MDDQGQRNDETNSENDAREASEPGTGSGAGESHSETRRGRRDRDPYAALGFDRESLAGFDAQRVVADAGSAQIVDLGRSLSEAASEAAVGASYRDAFASLVGVNAALPSSLSPGLDAVGSLASAQEQIAQSLLDDGSAVGVEIGQQFASSLAMSTFATAQLPNLTAGLEATSLAVRQADLQAASLESFDVSLLGERPSLRLAEHDAAVLVAASGLASTFFDAATHAIGELAAIERTHASAVMLAPARPTIYDALLRVVEEHGPQLALLPREEVEREFGRVPEARIGSLAHRLVELRRRVNQAGLRTNNAPVFQPTVETEYISVRLLQDVVDDEDGFDQFMDRIHKYVVECSDGMRNVKRYMPSSPPIVADVIILRNHYSHDPESESEAERNKKIRRVGRALTSLAGTPAPTAREEWQLAQLRILEHLVAFHEDLLAKIVESAAT